LKNTLEYKGENIVFGMIVKEKRLSLDITLREFCRRIEEDPSNWSKVERGVANPPRSKEKLDLIADVLMLKEGSDDRARLYDYAAVDSGILPEYIKADEQVLEWLPAFFRTVDNIKPSKEELYELINKLKEGG
jgi:transcriptional regulator with XRE-family HTH domain